MRFAVLTLFIGILSIVLQLFLPWWSAALAAFVIAFALGQNGLASFFGGFLGISLVWLGFALFIDIQTHAILTEKVAHILFMKNSAVLIMLTGAIGGLVGGFSALSGFLFKGIFR